MSRLWYSCLCTLVLFACDASNLVLLDIPRWPSLAQKLQVNSRLNFHFGHDIEVPARTPGMALYLPDDAQGMLRLSILAVDQGGTTVAGDLVTADITDETEFPLRRTLSLCPAPIQPNFEPRSSLWGMWGTGPTNVWITSQSGNLLHWDGSRWTAVASGVSSLTSIWGSGASDIWAVGGRGDVVHWDGSRWTPVASGVSTTLYAVWGSGPSDVWAGGSDLVDTMLHWDGSAWTRVLSTPQTPLLGIWGSGASDVWAVGGSGVILHWDGSAWTRVQSGTGQPLRGIWGSGPSDVWAGGSGGMLLHWNGSAWAPFPAELSTSTIIYSFWGSGASDVWAVGFPELLMHWNGIKWSVIPEPSPVPVMTHRDPLHLLNIWGNSTSELWFVGHEPSFPEEARIFHYRCGSTPN